MPPHPTLKVKIGTSSAIDEKEAVQDLFKQIAQPHMESILVFCSSKYNLDRLGKCLQDTFPCSVVGCTTAGELDSTGYHEGTITGASLGGETDTGAIKTHPQLISPLSSWSADKYEALASTIMNELAFSCEFNSNDMFGLLLVDGMSMLEESTIAHLHGQLRGIPIVGGSAGDDLNFKKTYVYHDGCFHSDAAVFTLVETTLPFVTFKTQHFVPTETKLVITEADPKNRRVMEINGEPADQAYADMLGMKKDGLNPAVFSNNPVILRIGGKDYVRSIQKVNEDGSLSFYCAIDNGLVLTLAQGVDIIENLHDQLLSIRTKIPDPALIIGCDCILRRLEVQEKGLLDDIQGVLKKENFVGFSTYGEQFNAIHINQTLTGVAIGGAL